MIRKPLITEGIRDRLTALKPIRKHTKTCRFAALILIVFCLLTVIACSGSKTATRKPMKPSVESDLLGAGEKEVIKKFGEPSLVSKTPDDHIIWVYVPKWKIVPNDKGTMYVEFEKDRVVKVFRTD